MGYSIHRSKEQEEKRVKYLIELQDLVKAGKSRQDAYVAFRGRRSESWVKEHFPKDKIGLTIRKAQNSSDVVEQNIKRLRSMQRDGMTIMEVVRAFNGEQSENWIRTHWKSQEHRVFPSYRGMDVNTVTKLIPVVDSNRGT